MRKVIYSMGVSLDGYVEGPNRELGWSTPDEELHRFWNDRARETGTFLYGRRLYELMADFWPTRGYRSLGPRLRGRVRPDLEGHAQGRVFEDPGEGRLEQQAGQGQHRRRGREPVRSNPARTWTSVAPPSLRPSCG